MEQEKKKKKHCLLIILLLLLLLGIAAGYILLRDTGEDTGLKAGFLPGLDAEALQAEVDADSIRIQINSTPVFEDGKSEGSLYIGNPDTNNYDMKVVITLDESDQIIYESELIPPGYYIDYDTLLSAPEPGTHAALAEIIYYTEDGSVQSQTNIRLKVIVKN